jgi:hypothetical protein
VLYHHENYDGSGYPEGLIGERIPLGARIFALADVYDALISDRPYRHAMEQWEGLDYIKEEDGMVKIGALTRLQDIANNAIIKTRYAALAEAAHLAASPHVREMGTLGGNICQLNRCWYFRKEENRFDCMRKGGETCYAIVGENRYHSLFGGVRTTTPPCASNCPGSRY